jgi:hypothetical protein
VGTVTTLGIGSHCQEAIPRGIRLVLDLSLLDDDKQISRSQLLARLPQCELQTRQYFIQADPHWLQFLGLINIR